MRDIVLFTLSGREKLAQRAHRGEIKDASPWLPRAWGEGFFLTLETAAYAERRADGCDDGADEVPEELDEFFLVFRGHEGQLIIKN